MKQTAEMKQPTFASFLKDGMFMIKKSKKMSLLVGMAWCALLAACGNAPA